MKTRFGLGLLVGLLLAAPLVSSLYLLHTALGTPFIPFDLFDAVTRILPGPVVSFGIDAMVRVLMFLGLSLSASSKTAEQIQAIGLFLGGCAVAAGIFFAVLSERVSRGVALPGVVLGIASAIPVVALSGHPVWAITALTVWGIAVSGVRCRIVGSGWITIPSSTIPVDRRRFLVTLGGATASITVLGAVVAAALRISSAKRGIAHAGTRGISRVEIQIDDGGWVPAVLRPPLSDLTWVIWRYDWPLQPGDHVFRVRCFDGAGVAQIEVPQDPHPSGASGIFSLRRTL